MDMHVEQRFHGHRVLRHGRMPLPGRACHVVVATRGHQPWFSSFHVACEAVRAFRQPSARGDAALLAWVLMPGRVHWLLQPGERTALATVVSRMKATAGAQVNRMLARAGPLWEPAFDCRALDQDEDLRVASRQFVAGALRAGRIEDFGGYPFWDCAWM
ncbi:MAG: transposase [Proteobacteria bacterium]|nr:transposase [Pseudomonadota bacterium]